MQHLMLDAVNHFDCLGHWNTGAFWPATNTLLERANTLTVLGICWSVKGKLAKVSANFDDTMGLVPLFPPVASFVPDSTSAMMSFLKGKARKNMEEPDWHGKLNFFAQPLQCFTQSTTKCHRNCFVYNASTSSSLSQSLFWHDQGSGKDKLLFPICQIWGRNPPLAAGGRGL